MLLHLHDKLLKVAWTVVHFVLLGVLQSSSINTTHTSFVGLTLNNAWSMLVMVIAIKCNVQ